MERLSYCKHCGKNNVMQCKQGWDMCVDCAKLYKRYSDLRHVVKVAPIEQANKADKKLMDIVDIYKERAAQGLKVPSSMSDYGVGMKRLELMNFCEWCGRTNVPRHSKYTDQCVDCGKMYGSFMNARSTLNKLVDKYREKAAKGYRVPIVMREYGIGGK